MNAIANEPDLYRSEAFAEEVLHLVAPLPVVVTVTRPMRWIANPLPMAAARIAALLAARSPAAPLGGQPSAT
jgi:hypothetical protein